MNIFGRIKNRLLSYSYKFQSFGDDNFNNYPYLEPKVSHLTWKDHLVENFDKPGMMILEIGSREVTGISLFKHRFKNATYVGFDFYSGENVDVVGDVHKLSSYFTNQKFDLIFSSSCFEHFAMPWIASIEIIKLLRMGGKVFIETHFSYGLHEMPWNFFQFSNIGLEVLFPSIFGINKIESGLSNPIVGRFSKRSSKYLRFQKVKNLFCHSYFYGEKIFENRNLCYTGLDVTSLLGGTLYPETRKNKQ